MSREIKCKQCAHISIKKSREGKLFCNRDCYMRWKRSHPNRNAYKARVFISDYWYLYMPFHPNAIKGGRYIAEHRYILEQKLGRLLATDEVAHHKNHNKTDNRPENLELKTVEQHNKEHANERRRNNIGQFTPTEISSMDGRDRRYVDARR